MKRLGAAIVLAAALAATTLGWAETARAATCDTSWAAAVDGDWGDATKWTNGVPDSGDPARDLACITVAGTYTVTIIGFWYVKGLTLGGASGTQTLRLRAYGYLQLTNQQAAESDGVLPNGRIVLDSGDGAYSELQVAAPGTLTNAGTIQTVQGTGGNRYLRGNLNNQGTLQLDHDTISDGYTGATTITSSGTINIASGKTWNLSGNTSFTQTAGTITNNGTFSQTGGTFSQTGGTATGNALSLSGVTVSPSGGSGSFDLAGTNTLGSDVGAGHTVTLVSATLNVPTSRTNSGTIVLDDRGGDYAWLNVAGPTGTTLTNQGTIVIDAGTTNDRYVYGPIVNNGTIQSNVTVAHSLLSGGSGSWTNNGTIEVAEGTTLDIRGATFTNQSGSTLTGGTYKLRGIFKYTGANVVTNSATIQLHHAGAGVQNESGADALANLATNTSTAQLDLQNGKALTTSGPLTNAGSVTVGGATGTALTSTGNYTQTGGSTVVDGTLTASGGAVQLNGGTLSGSGTVAPSLVNNGGTVRPGTSPGTLNVSGSYVQGSGGTLWIEITGAAAGQFDRLAVTGTATLDGTLRITTTQPYTPPPGQTFQIVSTGAGRFGTFATVQAVGYTIQYNANDVTAVATGGPTAVRLTSFTASLGRNGTLIRWRSTGATGLLGFNLYRERAGKLTRLNGRLILARGTSSWLDRAGRARDGYRLQGVRFDGRRIWLGRVTVRSR